MIKTNTFQNILILITVFAFFTACNQEEKQQQKYQNQIGDTPYNFNLDTKNFKLCDSLNTLHKRAYVKYKGGNKALKKELVENYKLQSQYKTYNGYFIIRFVVNCKDEAGRYRMEVLDENFNLANAPKELQKHILNLFKTLKNWQHPFYENKHYDGYKFITIKITNGQIQLV